MSVAERHLFCVYCDNQLAPQRTEKAVRDGRKFCGDFCRNEFHRTRYRPKDRQAMPTGDVGAAHELVVCADLLKRGFHVFRSIAPGTPVDLVVMKHGRMLRVEVTTGGRSPNNGKLRHHPKDTSRFDVLAVVEWDHAIHYFPEWPAEQPDMPEATSAAVKPPCVLCGGAGRPGGWPCGACGRC